ncbi:MAG: hypothetical protein CBC09_04400 [Cellvibrionales bacterium TMED49]|nr:prepilin peptidase [Porticoccaceae bacterium]OUU38863.1 MAG: hypothetical protein CBC09_04400 [Cellvibrionales bacterium TMED49]
MEPELIRLHSGALTLLSFIFGVVFGSFLNVIIARLPKKLENQWRRESLDYLQLSDTDIAEEEMGISYPKSHCPNCKTILKWWQNIPLISFFLLRGRCSTCKKEISLLYPIIEFFAGLITILSTTKFGLSSTTIYALIFSYSLLALIAIDAGHKILPDIITIPLLWMGLFVNSQDHFTNLHSAVLGALLGYLFLWTVFQMFRLVTGKHGLGYGDFKLLAAIGAWLGWQLLPITLVLSSLTALITGFIALSFKLMKKEDPIPFGAFISAVGLILLYAEPGDAFFGLVFGEIINKNN